MTSPKNGATPGAKAAEPLDDTALEDVQGGARVPSHTPDWKNPNGSDPGGAAGYIGETEKNLSKAFAGTKVTHDVEFER